MPGSLTKGRTIAWISAAMLCSGFAGLAYQVAWTRQLISITSAVASAQATILAVFMFGLGLGSFLAAGLAPRLRRPLWWYALIEVAAASAALVLTPLLWQTAGLIPWFAKHFPGLAPHWPQLVVSALLFLVPTTLLGMTLPLVIEQAERLQPDPGLSRRGAVIGVLYGLNTLGAAAGTFVAGYLLVERLGLSGTVWVGVAMALAAAAMAWAVGGKGPAAKASPEGGTGSPETGRLPLPLVTAAFLGGFVGLGCEVAFTRLVSSLVENTVYSFSQVLAAVLIGIGLGGFLIAAPLVRASRTSSEPAQRVFGRVVLLQVLAAAWIGFVPVVLMRLSVHQDLFLRLARGFSLGGLAILLGLLVPPAALTASLLPMLAAGAALPHGSRAFGRLYAANTVGAVLGSLVCGFVLLPAIGVHACVALLGALSLGIGLLLLRRSSGSRRALTALLLSAAIGTVNWLGFDLPRQIYQGRIPSGSRILELREGAASDAMVTEEQDQVLKIWLNANWVATTGGRHLLLGHLPALLLERPERALGIALGTGQTFWAALQHGFSRLDCVEINELVIDLARKWFRQANGGLLDDPRVLVVHADGRAYLRATDQDYDLIVLEPLQAWSAGTSALYSLGFYQEARRVLRPGGIVAQWIPFYGQAADETRAMVRAGLEVFPEASLWLDLYDGILMLHNGPFRLPLSDLARRVRERGVGSLLRNSSVEDLPDLLSLFLSGPRGLHDWTSGAPLLVDDRPFLEFVAARTLGVPAYTPIMSTLLPYLEDPADYLAAPEPQADGILAEAVAIRSIIAQVNLNGDDGNHDKNCAVLEEAMARFPDSRRLPERYREEVLGWLDAVEAQKGGESSIEPILRRALAHDASFGEAEIGLARIENGRGRPDLAREHLGRAAQQEDTRDRAEALLRTLAEPVAPAGPATP